MLIHGLLQVYKLKLPLPFRLNHVNVYAIKGREGWWIVDTGLNTAPSRQGWLEFMAEHAICPGDIKGIYLTHYHPDHFGSAGWLQEISGAPVYISALDAGAVQRFWQTGEQSARALPEMFAQQGMPHELNAAVAEEMSRLIPFTRPHPNLTVMNPGTKIRLGDFAYEVILTPGHSDGHVCFYNREHGLLFSGDHLLPKITSNISLWPEGAPDPLKDFLSSLNSNRALGIQMILPSHGEVFKELAERIDQLLSHHAERLGLIKALVAGESTVYEICNRLFVKELSLHEMRFAMSETFAHLMHLVYDEQLKVELRNKVYIFSPC